MNLKATEKSKSMNDKLVTTILPLHRMAKPRAESLVDRILELEKQIFIDQSPDVTRRKMLGEFDAESWVMTMESGGELIGYNLIRVKHVEFGGKTIARWSSRAGLLPSYRGRNLTLSLPGKLFWNYRRRYPFRKIYGLITLIHPASFKLFASTIPNLYPFPRHQLRGHDQKIFQSLLAASGLSPVPGKADFVVEDNTVAIMAPYEEGYWTRNPHPAVRFFLEHNDRYLDGQALASFFPINARLIARMPLQKFGLLAGIHSWWRRISPMARRRHCTRLLLATHFADLLKSGEIDKMAHLLKVRGLKPGQTLIVQGGYQDNIYILTQGALLVSASTDEGELVLDQLSPGEYVGEIGAILKTPATATVRAVGRCTLLEITQIALASLPGEGEIMQDFRATMTARLFENSKRFGKPLDHGAGMPGREKAGEPGSYT